MNGPFLAASKAKPFLPTFAKFRSLLQHYAATRSVTKNKLLHAQIITNGLLLSSNSANLLCRLAESYALCGCVPFARKMFDDLPDRRLFLWNAIIRMYVDNGLPKDALNIFVCMVNLGQCKPDKFTYPFVIKACGDLSVLDVGIVIHGRTLVAGFNEDMFVHNSLLAMYMNCGAEEVARQVFDTMHEWSVVSWNTVISGYFRNGCSKEALMVFNQMMVAGLEPDCATVVSVLPACGHLKELELGRKIQQIVEERHLGDKKIVVKNALVDMYAKCGSINEARLVFEKMDERDVVTWTSMINGYVFNRDARSALALCQAMQFDGIRPNNVTMASLLSACASSNYLKQGRSLHAWAIKRKLETDVIVETSLIDMYAKCSRVDISFCVFGATSKRRTVPWNALLSGCIHNGLAREAIELFRQMLMEAVKPNIATLNSLIPAYTVLADIKQVLNIHCYLVRSGFISRIEVSTGLIGTYSKCGSLESAHEIFREIPKKDKDIFAWSVIIAAYGMHGNGEIAVSLFYQMVQSGIKPNEITFTSILQSCSHAGMVDQGLELFKYMRENHPSSPNVDHYTCIVDLLGRAGRLDEAYSLIETMPFKHNHSIWGALLGACVIHENVDLGEVAAKRLFELEPENTGNYVLLAKIYASVGSWREAEKVRDRMSEIGLRKTPAHSLIEVGTTSFS